MILNLHLSRLVSSLPLAVAHCWEALSPPDLQMHRHREPQTRVHLAAPQVNLGLRLPVCTESPESRSGCRAQTSVSVLCRREPLNRRACVPPLSGAPWSFLLLTDDSQKPQNRIRKYERENETQGTMKKRKERLSEDRAGAGARGSEASGREGEAGRRQETERSRKPERLE